jgi:hypothetical protein
MADLDGQAGTRWPVVMTPTARHGRAAGAGCGAPAEADYVVQYGTRDGYWPGGPFRGFRIPAGDYSREIAVMDRIDGGRIAERWAARDDLAMMLQLGALTAQP